jgi:hypothetical protein
MTAGGAFPDEAARLLAAAETWLRNASGDNDARLPRGVHDIFGPSDAHSNDSPCQICPLCQLISAARKLRPEVVEHLTAAATSVLLALRALAEPPEQTPTAPSHQPAPPRATVVQHITVN